MDNQNPHNAKNLEDQSPHLETRISNNDPEDTMDQEKHPLQQYENQNITFQKDRNKIRNQTKISGKVGHSDNQQSHSHNHNFMTIYLQETQQTDLRNEYNETKSKLPPNFLEKYTKYGPWKPYENISSESVFFSFLPNCFFKWRNILFWPLSLYPFACIKMCWGELILCAILYIGTLVLSLLIIISDKHDRPKALERLAGILYAFTFISATKNLVFHLFIGIPFQRQIIFHKCAAYLGLAVSIAHYAVLRYESLNTNPTIGLIILVGFMVFGSCLHVRRYFYRFFYIMHVVTAPFIVAYSFYYQYKAILFGAAFYAVDLLIKGFVILRNQLRIQKTEIFLMPGGYLRVDVTPKPGKKTKFRCGQVLFINVPGVSCWEWHPFGISTSYFDEKIILHFKVFGDWAYNLREYVKAKGHKISIKHHTTKNNHMDPEAQWPREHYKEVLVLENALMMNGPYGCSRVNIDSPKYKVALCMTGGVGVTPVHSMFNELVLQYIRGRPFHKIKFVWAVRTKELFYSVASQPNSLLNQVLKPPAGCTDQNIINRFRELRLNDVVEAEVYLSREKDPNLIPLIESNFRLKLSLGRPNLGKIFDSIGQVAADNGESRVALLTSGPSVLVYGCYAQSHKSSKHFVVNKGSQKIKKKVKFDFQHQVLEF